MCGFPHPIVAMYYVLCCLRYVHTCMQLLIFDLCVQRFMVMIQIVYACRCDVHECKLRLLFQGNHASNVRMSYGDVNPALEERAG